MAGYPHVLAGTRPRLSGTLLADGPVRRSAWVKENTEPARQRALDGGYEGHGVVAAASRGQGSAGWLPEGLMFAAFGSLYCQCGFVTREAL